VADRNDLGGFHQAHSKDYDKTIQAMSDKYKVPARLIKSVMAAESSFDPKIVHGEHRSSAGAIGAMQLMPGTARELGVSDPTDPAQNIEGGTKYLASLLNKYEGNVTLAVAAYNAGPGRVHTHRDPQTGKLVGSVPNISETQSYVHKVMADYNRNGDVGATVEVDPIRTAANEWSKSQPKVAHFSPQFASNSASSPWLYGIPASEDKVIRYVEIAPGDTLASLIAQALNAMGIEIEDEVDDLLADPELLAAVEQLAPAAVLADPHLATSLAADPVLLASAISADPTLADTLIGALGSVNPSLAASVADKDPAKLAAALAQVDPKQLADALGDAGLAQLAQAVSKADPQTLARALSKAAPQLVLDNLLKAEPRRALDILLKAHPQEMAALEKANHHLKKAIQAKHEIEALKVLQELGAIAIPDLSVARRDGFHPGAIARKLVNLTGW
jgi:hypothetical protein